jgi:hypothetical protein
MEAKYFIHLSRRLGYLKEDVCQSLEQQAGHCFACLHGLIQAVERESGKLAKLTAAVTSALMIAILRLS